MEHGNHSTSAAQTRFMATFLTKKRNLQFLIEHWLEGTPTPKPTVIKNVCAESDGKQKQHTNIN